MRHPARKRRRPHQAPDAEEVVVGLAERQQLTTTQPPKMEHLQQPEAHAVAVLAVGQPVCPHEAWPTGRAIATRSPALFLPPAAA